MINMAKIAYVVKSILSKKSKRQTAKEQKAVGRKNFGL